MAVFHFENNTYSIAPLLLPSHEADTQHPERTGLDTARGAYELDQEDFVVKSPKMLI